MPKTLKLPTSTAVMLPNPPRLPRKGRYRPPLPMPRGVADARCAEIIRLTNDVDTTMIEQAGTITDQQAIINAQAAYIEELEAIIDEGGDIIPPDPEPGRKPDLWVKFEASGSGDGSSPENARAYSSLPSLIGSAGPNKVIGLIGDGAEWPKVPGLSIDKGGAEGGLIHVMGCDTAGNARRILLKSGREPFLDFTDPKYHGDDPSSDNAKIPIEEWSQGTRGSGTTLFTFKGTANWLKFSHINAVDIDSFAYYAVNIMGHAYSDIDLWNIKHGWHMTDDPPSGSSAEKCIERMLWERIRADWFEEDVFRWRGTSHHLVAQDFELHSNRCQGHITFGFNIGTGDDARNDTVTDWEIKRGIITGCHDTHYEKPWCSRMTNGKPEGECYYPAPGKIRNPNVWNGDVPGKDYWNGDGISAERGCDRGLIEDMSISGCTDAACDVKAANVTFRRVHAFDNKRNFRLYSPGLLMEECLSEHAYKRGGSGGTAHIYLKGADASGETGVHLTLDRCTFRGAPSNAFSYESQYKWDIQVDGEETCHGDGVTLNPPPYVKAEPDKPEGKAEQEQEATGKEP